MTKQSILVRLASLAMILVSLVLGGTNPPLARAADDVGATPDTPIVRQDRPARCNRL